MSGFPNDTRSEDRLFSEGLVFFEQRRFVDAEARFRRLLALNPNFGQAIAHRAICLLNIKQDAEALREAKRAVACSPKQSYTHYALGFIYGATGKLRESEKALKEALRLSPESADYLSYLGRIYLILREPDKALEATSHALQISPNHVDALEVRSRAFRSKGLLDQSEDAARRALALDPEAGTVHQVYGWTLLEQGKRESALRSFAQALQANPDSKDAREGALMALQARYPFYRITLSYLFFMSRAPRAARIVLVLVLFGLPRLYGNVYRTNPEAAKYFLPISIIAGLFIFLLYFAPVMANMFLLLNPYGKLVLTRGERVAAGVFALMIPLAIAMGCVALAARSFGVGIMAGCFALTALIAGLIGRTDPREQLKVSPGFPVFAIIYFALMLALVLFVKYIAGQH